MQLTQIITLASAKVRLPFLAMVRSLRAVGSDLPVRVIPFGEADFKLETGAEWWPEDKLLGWLSFHNAHPMMRKYQCLLTSNYHFVDTDVIFLRDPGSTLVSSDGFVTSCGHWHNPAQTVTERTHEIFHARSTTWPKSVFNAGQFACDRVLYTDEALRETAESAECIETCLKWPYHDQPGLNLLVHLAGVPVSNLTLPPVCMESTWAGDYAGDPEPYWTDPARKPYLIHWAGAKPNGSRQVDSFFFEHLTGSERQEWLSQVRREESARSSILRTGRHRAMKAWRAIIDN